MDGLCFDGWARTLATGQTRRRTLQRVAGGIFAGLFAQFTVEEAAACVGLNQRGCTGPRAKRCCGNDKVCRNGECRCKPGLKQCGRSCVNLKTDEKHCGRCRRRCRLTETCKNGDCTCKPGRTRCGGRCVRLKTSESHCGRCNNPCLGSSRCENGECTGALGCTAGVNFCQDGSSAQCPQAAGCFCVTDVEGFAHCSDLSDGFCDDCTESDDCPSGFVCTDGSGFCGCDQMSGGNGNKCVIATCVQT